MKIRWLITVAMAVASVAHGQVRTFASADGTKKFDATLLAYREKDQLVTVRMKGRTNTVNFNISILSEDDQAYVKDQAQALRAANALKLSFERYRKKDESNADARMYLGGYEIGLRNLAADPIKNVEIEYLIVYRKGSLAAGTDVQTERGSETFSELSAGTDEKILAGKVSLQSAASRDKQACSGST
jgi:hypothetical protein